MILEPTPRPIYFLPFYNSYLAVVVAVARGDILKDISQAPEIPSISEIPTNTLSDLAVYHYHSRCFLCTPAPPASPRTHPLC